jgi:hypothetical protein
MTPPTTPRGRKKRKATSPIQSSTRHRIEEYSAQLQEEYAVVLETQQLNLQHRATNTTIAYERRQNEFIVNRILTIGVV